MIGETTDALSRLTYLRHLSSARCRYLMINETGHLMLAPGVRHLDEATAVFQAMLEGWKRQQDSRYLRERTIGARLRTVRRFAEFTGQYPWQWGPAEIEAFTSDLVSGSLPAAHSTVRNYQTALQMFCTFITDARYGWAEECERRFGEAPVQICHEWNTVAHLAEYEGQPGRRALTYDEVQALFDAADARAGQIRCAAAKARSPRCATRRSSRWPMPTGCAAARPPCSTSRTSAATPAPASTARSGPCRSASARPPAEAHPAAARS